VGDEVRVLVSEGCHLYKESISNLSQGHDRNSEVKAVCEASDIVIMCLGLDAGLEGEEGDEGNQYASGDKPNLDLPGRQQEILEVAYASGKPVVLVLLSGSALAVNWADEHIPAIIQGWYPGAQGGRAIAQVLFGEKNPEGRMPVTFYRSTEELPDFTDYSMKGRTYRYMKKEALYPFGYGLSYTEFTYTDVKTSAEVLSEEGITISATLTNTGKREGTETVQAYVKADREGTPNAQLKGIAKVSLKPGESREVAITLPLSAFALYDEEAVNRVGIGTYLVSLGGSQPEERSEKLTGRKVSVVTVRSEKEVVLH
jgi:beta-glucosidase